MNKKAKEHTKPAHESKIKTSGGDSKAAHADSTAKHTVGDVPKIKVVGQGDTHIDMTLDNMKQANDAAKVAAPVVLSDDELKAQQAKVRDAVAPEPPAGTKLVNGQTPIHELTEA